MPHEHSDHCKALDPMLHATAEGKANKVVSWFIKLHTVRCGPCRRFLASMEKIVSGLRQVGSEAPDPEAMDRLAHGPWRSAANDHESR
jgi:hypothetical protein